MELLKGFLMHIEQDEDKRWRLKRDISIADIISFVSAALAVIYAYTTLDKRVTLLETMLVDHKIATKKQDEELVRLQARIDVRLDKLDEKIERLLQRAK